MRCSPSSPRSWWPHRSDLDALAELVAIALVAAVVAEHEEFAAFVSEFAAIEEELAPLRAKLHAWAREAPPEIR